MLVRNRFFEEPYPTADSDKRLDVERDYGRVLHSGAFRRLQGKAQVVPTGHADYFRTRLTHSLEVAQIARSLAKRTGRASVETTEVAALIHDLGHPPFGHNGEHALKIAMDSHGGFEGNAQSFRIVANLEMKFSPSDLGGRRVGLNLSKETLAASFKYPWPRGAKDTERARKFGYYSEEPEAEVAQWVLGGAEAQKTDAANLVDLADDIAYSVHDLEDGIRANLIPINVLKLLRSEQQNFLRSARQPTADGDPALEVDDSVLEALLADDELFGWAREPYRQEDDQRGQIKRMTSGLISRFVRSIDKPAEAGEELKFPKRFRQEVDLLKRINWYYVIESRELQTLRFRERAVVTQLTTTLMDSHNAKLLPAEKLQQIDTQRTTSGRERTVCDFVAGMTDRYADLFYARLFGSHPQSITDLI